AGAVDELARRLRLGSALVSATNGKTTTAAMAAGILRGQFRLAHNASGANLVSGVASALLAADDAELGLFEVDEAALPEVARRVLPRGVLVGNLFRDQLDRYGELEHVAERWRAALAGLPETGRAANADDPLLGDLAQAHAGRVRTFGIDDPRHARPSLQHAADSKYCPVCGRPFLYAAAYVGHLGDYACPEGHLRRPPLDVAARQLALAAREASLCALGPPEGPVPAGLPPPGLYNVYTAPAAAALAGELGVPAAEIGAGLESFGAAFGRFERIAVGERRVLMLL